MKQISAHICAITISAIFLLTTSCQKQLDQETPTLAEEQTNVAASSGVEIPEQIRFTQFGLYPEGVAYDKFNDRFLVSSFGMGPAGTPYYGTGTIGSVSADGKYMAFIRDPDLKSILGLHIDEARKRIVVAVTDGWLGDVAKLGVYDLETGKQIWLIDLASLHPGGIHLADDLTIDPQGNIYITDVKSPLIYKVDVNGHASVFFENSFFAEPNGFAYYWVGFNGIVYDNSGFLIVAFYAGSFVGKPSLIKIPIDDPQHFTGVQLDVPIASPDGILLSRDGKELIIVDNKFFSEPGEIIHMSSNDKWVSAKRIETFHTGFTFPTTATSNGREVFVIYSFLGVPGQSEFMIQKMPFALQAF